MLRVLSIALVIVGAAACSTSQQPPVVPGGPHPVNATFQGTGPAGCGTAPSILAATSRSEIVGSVESLCRSQCNTPGLACWAELPSETGELYVAVLTVNECNRPVDDSVASSGHTLYFIHRIGKPLGVCNLLMALPAWRLYTVPMSVLPGSGVLTVELQVRDQATGTSTYDAQVTLG